MWSWATLFTISCLLREILLPLLVNTRILLKPVIHYSRTGQIGNETIFSPNKILFAKTGRTCCYTLFIVCCQFLWEHIRHWEHERISFFDKKFLCVRQIDYYSNANPANSLRRKTCANTYCGLFALCPYFVILPLFRRCLRIVYSGLQDYSRNKNLNE